MEQNQKEVLLVSCIALLGSCVILAMPTSDSPYLHRDTAGPTGVLDTPQPQPQEDIGREPQDHVVDPDYVDHKDDTFDEDDEDDEDDIYDDEEFLSLLLKDIISTENDNTEPESTSSSDDHSEVAPTTSSLSDESPVSTDDQAVDDDGHLSTDDQALDEDGHLQARERNSPAVPETLNVLAASTGQPVPDLHSDKGMLMGSSAGPTPSYVAIEFAGFPEQSTANSRSAPDGVERSAPDLPDGGEWSTSGVPDCESAMNEDITDQERMTTTQRNPSVVPEDPAASQSRPCGRDARILVLQSLSGRRSAQISGTGESVRTSGQLQDTREIELEFGNHIGMTGLNGRGHVAGAENDIYNGSSGNDYNIAIIDSNIEIPPGGANMSDSGEINVRLTDPQQQPAVVPVVENHQVKADELPSTSDQQPGDNVAGRNKTNNNSTLNLISAEKTNSLFSTMYSHLEPSFSGTSSLSHDVTSSDFSQATAHNQASWSNDLALTWPFDDVITASVSTFTNSHSHSGAQSFHDTELWSHAAQTATLHPRDSWFSVTTELWSHAAQTATLHPRDSWFSVTTEHTGDHASLTPVDIISSTIIVPTPIREVTEDGWSSDDVENLTSLTATLTATSSTQSIEDADLSTTKTVHTDSIPTQTNVKPSLVLKSSHSSPDGTVLPITNMDSTSDPFLQNISSKADYIEESHTISTALDMGLPFDPSDNETTTVNEFQPESSSISPSRHPPTIRGSSTETLVAHTKSNQPLTRNPTHVVTIQEVKSGLYPHLSENTLSLAEPEREAPPFFLELKLRMSWRDFCQNEDSIRKQLVDILQGDAERVKVTSDQIQLAAEEQERCHRVTQPGSTEISVHMYLVDKTGQPDLRLTLACANILESSITAGEVAGLRSQLMSVRLVYADHGLVTTTDSSLNPDHEDEEVVNIFSDPGVTIAIVLATVGGCYCLGVITLQILVRYHSQDSAVPRFKHSFSVTSSDSMQLTSVNKSRPNSGIFNPGLDLTDLVEVSNPLNLIQLSKMCMDEASIHEEYQRIPHQMARSSVVPAGDEDKNRYANVLPLAHTRVRLLPEGPEGPEPRSSYINANYVTGPNKKSRYYIATQGPTETTTADLWTMVWQQGCKVIVMLTLLEEEGQIKCAGYLPELVGKCAAQQHGHFLIELLQKDVHQEYIYSRLQVNNLREIETRQVDHFWYTCWPPVGVPEPISLVKLVLETRPRYEHHGSPLVVHCSPGTGRTCTFIALDLCMRQFEERRVVDVMKTVHNIRQERAGAVQNKEQYTLLYNAVSEYAMIVVSPVISAASSATTLHALLQS